MATRVLVLGGAGFVGRRIAEVLQRASGFAVTVASRHAGPVPGCAVLALDALDADALRGALRRHDAVVNCVTGSAATIVDGARSLAKALPDSGCRRLVHMSSMAAFGDVQGDVDDDTPFGEGGGWYAEAKREAEGLLCALAGQDLDVAALRPGCVFGAGSVLWVSRVGDWLRRRRIGDLGSAGDGWSNLVHVEDVAQATWQALQRPWAAGQVLRANLSAPDSPRWNDYFVQLGCAIGATPVLRIDARQLRLDAYLAAAALRVGERLAPKLGLRPGSVPPALPPSLLRLFAQDRRLRSRRATERLGLRWTGFRDAVVDSARWYCALRPLTKA